MTIKQFLIRHVEGYLFKDLRTISRVKLRKGQKIGGVGYPMISSILAGMELLGGLLQVSQFKMDPSAGNSYFMEYWDNYFSKSSPQYARFGSVFRKLVRHGIAHTYLTKTGIWIIKGKPQMHLQIFTDNGNHYLVIDLLEFYNDFINSYTKMVKPLVWGIGTNINKQTMQDRLNEMISAYEAQSNSELATLATSPQPPSQAFRALIGLASTGPASGTAVTYSGTAFKK